MSQTQELIEQIRTKLEGATDYRIAQVIDIPRNLMHYYVKGERSADPYTCAKIAEILERDPLEIIAQVEAEAARTEKKREFWRSFFSGLKRTAHAVAWCAIAIGSGAGLQAGKAEAGPLASSHNGRLRQRPEQKQCRPMGGFFCLEFASQSRRKSQSSATKKTWHSAG